jgi:WD40 repeat protein
MNEPPTSAAPKPDSPSLFQRAINFLFGYDFFISYAWADARHYALTLAKKLDEQGFQCFLDSSGFAKGEDWRQAGGRALRKTARLLLLVSPGALRSDAVMREVDAFRKSGKTVLPIDFGATLHRVDLEAALHALLPGEILRIVESAAALETGPSEETLREVRQSFDLLRQDQKRVRWLAGAVGLFALIAVVAVAAGVIAEIRRREALSRGLAAQAVVESERQLDLALLLAAEAHAVRQTNQSKSSLLRLLHIAPVERFVHVTAAAGCVKAHPTRPEIVAVATWDGNVELRDVRRHTQLATVQTGNAEIFALSFSRDGKLLCCGGANLRLLVWEVANDGATLREVARAPHPAGKVIRALHLLDDRSVIVGADEATLRRYSLADGAWSTLPAVHTAPVSAITRDASGTHLVTAGSDWQIVFWKLSDSTFSTHDLLRGDDWVLSLSLSQDGKWLAAATHDKAVELWDLHERRLVTRLPMQHPGGRIFAVGFAPDGRSLLWAGDDGAINTFILVDGSLQRTFTHSDAVLDFDWTADGARLVTAGRDRKLSVWNVAQLSPVAREVTRFVSGSGWITASAHSDAQDALLLGDEGGNLLLADSRTGQLAPAYRGHQSIVTSLLAIENGGRAFVSTGGDRKVRWWQLENGQLKAAESVSVEVPLRRLLRATDDRSVLGVTATGDLYGATRGAAAAVRLGASFDNTPAAQPPAVFAAHPRLPLIAAASRTELTLFDVKLGTRRAAPTAEDFIHRMQYSPVGDELLSAVGSTIEIREPNSGVTRARLQIGRLPPVDWALSNTGMMLCAEGEARLTWWDLAARMQLGSAVKLPAVDVAAVHFCSGQNVWLTLERNFVEGRHHYVLRAWEADAALWAQRAREIANRPLSALEAARFGR